MNKSEDTLRTVACSGVFIGLNLYQNIPREYLNTTCKYCSSNIPDHKINCRNCGAPNDNFVGYGRSIG